MKYFTSFKICSIVIFILLILARALHHMDIEKNNTGSLVSMRNILVYVSCALSCLCFALLQLSIKNEEKPLIPIIWPYTMFGFVLCTVSSIALGNVAIFYTDENSHKVRINAISDIPRIACIICINLLILKCMKRLIVLKYDSEYVSNTKREFVPRKIVGKSMFIL